MASSERPPIFNTAVEGWSAGIRTGLRMPMVFGIAIVLMFILNLAMWQVTPAPKDPQSWPSDILNLLDGVVQGFLLTPVAIAAHRFVLLGETTDYYIPNPSDPRFMKFFVASTVLQLMMALPFLLMAKAFEPNAATGLGAAAGFGFLVLAIAAVIVTLRVLILFPAIAVDAPGANWRNALFDSKGYAWRMFWIFALAWIPALALSLPLYFLVNWPEGPTLVGRIILAADGAVVTVITLAVFAAIASRLYRAVSVRQQGVEQPA